MFKSILHGGGAKRKFRVACPTVYNVPSCANLIAGILPGQNDEADYVPTMVACPLFFGGLTSGTTSASSKHKARGNDGFDETKFDLSSKSFSPPQPGWLGSSIGSVQGWCTPPPHKLGHFMTAAHTIVHEMTHIRFIASPALGHGQTEDIIKRPDENDPKNLKTYDGWAPAVARTLKQHWDTYNVHIAHKALGERAGDDPDKDVSKRGEHGPQSSPAELREPPLATTRNAESYAAAATG
ncbi:hypothetical protein GYMLUDRAFT_51935 [Collybiopsis luxurians FD-317 M1]|nr:hypothetical protein GYMLUDRAFT_51935 [Collybiopsis luxurians FD-317 M1]